MTYRRVKDAAVCFADPGWSVLQRSLDLRRKGVELKTLVRPAPLQQV